ncbi:MAG: Ppx/GppA phosphatase family protein [Polyangiaceae bacterium]
MSAPARRVAAIDIGTNSVLLLVAEVTSSGALRPVLERATITRLGEGVDRARVLKPEAIDRTLACLAEYGQLLREQGAGSVDAVGTSAMRDARGGEVFVERARELIGVAPRVISGVEEATLTFRGGLSGLVLDDGPVVLFDVGGGSTEIVRGAIDRGVSTPSAEPAISLDIGSVRLTERHVRSDPPTPDELRAVAADVDRALDAAPNLHGATLVGVAGTVTTIAAVAQALEPYDGARVHGAALTLTEVERVATQLAETPLAARCKLPGLSPKRADVIVAGAWLTARLMKRAGADRLVVSDRGVRWGLAEQLASH